ncbi:unnamed protein product [Calypogeia fissa]
MTLIARVDLRTSWRVKIKGQQKIIRQEEAFSFLVRGFPTSCFNVPCYHNFLVLTSSQKRTASGRAHVQEFSIPSHVEMLT